MFNAVTNLPGAVVIILVVTEIKAIYCEYMETIGLRTREEFHL